MRGGIGIAQDGDAVAVAAGMARAEDGGVTEGFELGGDGGADFTGAEDGDVHGAGLSPELGFQRAIGGRDARWRADDRKGPGLHPMQVYIASADNDSTEGPMEVDIAAISLDVANFRHAKVSHERDAIRMLLGDEKVHKVSELAQDIIDQRGLDPSSLLIVTNGDREGEYVALEGNRRITALKTMMTPALAEGLPVHQTFKKLHDPFLALNIKKVECVLLSRTDAAIWIKRKHYKGMGGRGTMAWNAVATARSDASEGRFSRWMTSLAFVESHGTDAEDLRDRIAGKTTTVERVLLSSQMSTLLGLQFGTDGSLVPENGDDEAALKLLLAMLQAMAESTFKETVVSTADQQREWLEKFVHLNVKKPDPVTTTASTTAATGGTAATTTATQPAATTTPASTSSKSKPSAPRKYLADKGLRISNSGLNKFYAELRKLSVQKNPFVCAAVVRVFLEKATTLFLEEMSVPTLNTTAGATWHDYGVKLKDKVATALRQIDPSGSAPKLAAARDVANGVHGRLHTLDQLNRAIHDHADLPAGSEILTIWDRFHPYLHELFEAIEKSKP
ncbi:hypothetical protein [Devosia sp. SL43]|uniref:hypothetical protein n=1 Tax=Devosia sp. SL43 TaxID=2806348 RepID=UPI001F3C3795|nr:hypothetical protein [Devosia sp. SL43]UJW86209.1 hypothetical protein IM737_02710 [Devosia sp. SL43]